uniref:Uncharacterized protein n=1 Tax=Cacopsylla melanoneura TaxID=428564 RepID=A0A8D8Y6P9_9HEMI
MFIPIRVLTEYRPRLVPPVPGLEPELLLAGNGISTIQSGRSLEQHIQHGHFLLVRQQTVDQQGTSLIGEELRLGHVVNVNCDVPAGLSSFSFFLQLLQNPFPRPVKVLELKDPRKVQGQVFLRVPGGGAE